MQTSAKILWCEFKSNLELMLTMAYFTVSYFSFDKQCLSRVGFLLKCFNYPFCFFFFLSQQSLSHKKAPPRELTEEEKQQILHSEEFLIFFDRTIRVIERALAEDSDIFFDYSGRELEEKDGLVS